MIDDILVSVPIKFPVEVIKIANHLGYKVCELIDADINGISGKVCHKEKIIYINPADIKTRQRFTIAHEIGHILLHATSNSLHHRIEDKTINIYSDSVEEVEANRFASILLMPTLEFQRQWSLANSLTSGIDPIEEVAAFFQVSKLAASIRANNLNLISL